MKKTLAALAVLVVLPVVARAQKPVTDTEAIELTTKIEAIDKTARLLTLKDKDGDTETILCGPEVKRFDELKVGVNALAVAASGASACARMSSTTA